MASSLSASDSKALPPDPLANGGLVEFARRLRAQEITAQQAVTAYLERIAILNPQLDAYVFVAEQQALAAAEAVDKLLAAGIDLGLLMGVPVAIKDLFAVSGMPTKAGSNLDVAEHIGSEGTFIRQLKRAGCVILGKTRTTEFAAGAINLSQAPPWNPCDIQLRRTPGGSSHGSAVAVAAGLCGFAVGSDTGGSVRVPAALCGTVGLKVSYGKWPLDGIFPLCPSLDTIGLLCASAEDAALAYASLTGESEIPRANLHGTCLGIPEQHCLEPAEPEVVERFERARRKLQEAGATLVAIDWPSAQERKEVDAIFAGLVPAQLLTTLGKARFIAQREQIDPIVVNRLQAALTLSATEYIHLQRKAEYFAQLSAQRLQGLDAIISPTSALTPRPLTEINGQAAALAFVAKALSNSRIANAFDLCAVSVPINGDAAALPVGLQLASKAQNETKLLALAKAVAVLLAPRFVLSKHAGSRGA